MLTSLLIISSLLRSQYSDRSGFALLWQYFISPSSRLLLLIHIHVRFIPSTSSFPSSSSSVSTFSQSLLLLSGGFLLAIFPLHHWASLLFELWFYIVLFSDYSISFLLSLPFTLPPHSWVLSLTGLVPSDPQWTIQWTPLLNFLLESMR